MKQDSELINELDRAIARLPKEIHGRRVTLEGLQEIHNHERELACQEMDRMAEEFKRQDEERRKKWGNKFPVHYLDQPKEVHPVKVKKAKGRKKT